MRTAFIACTLAVLPALAQQDAELVPGQAADEAAQPIRRYAVELILFAYGDGISSGNELFLPDDPADAGPAPEEGFFRRYRAADESLTEIEPPPIERRYADIELAPLEPGEFTTDDIYKKLTELDAYLPIMRAGWSQITVEKSLTAPIALRTLADVPDWFGGHVLLYRGRYLHFVVDVTMDSVPATSSQADVSSSPVPTFGDARVGQDFEQNDDYGQPRPVRYRIFEDRIMRNGDLRYFDHPKFGLIVKVRRLEEAEPEFRDDTGDLLPGGLVGP